MPSPAAGPSPQCGQTSFLPTAVVILALAAHSFSFSLSQFFLISKILLTRNQTLQSPSCLSLLVSVGAVILSLLPTSSLSTKSSLYGTKSSTVIFGPCWALLQTLLLSQILNISITLNNWPQLGNMHNFPLCSKYLPSFCCSVIPFYDLLLQLWVRCRWLSALQGSADRI